MNARKLTVGLLAIVSLGLAVALFSIQQAWGAPEHAVPEYAHDEYTVGGDLHVKTQQICKTPESHDLPVDWGFATTGVVIHTISAPGRGFSGTLDVGRLASWEYVTTNIETYNTVEYSNTGDLLWVKLNDSAIRITSESPVCLFRFPRLVLVNQESNLNVFVPLNASDVEKEAYPAPK